MLGDEERASIAWLVRRAGVDDARRAAEKLCAAVEWSMQDFRVRAAASRTFRQSHDALRAICKLADVPDPPIQIIRIRLAQLPRDVISPAEHRALLNWNRVFKGEEAPDNFADWLQKAPPHRLLEAIRSFFSDGGALVAGRSRPGGRRSKSQFEPNIFGQIRGAGGTHTKARGGRPKRDTLDNLVAHLALDWAHATGQVPTQGRSDHGCFGALVYDVFSWLEPETKVEEAERAEEGRAFEEAEQALRRYWDDVASAEVTRTETGETRS